MKKIAIVTKKCPDYLKGVIEKMQKSESLKVNGLNAGELAEIEKENPEIFAKIKEFVVAGRWYPFAGLWQKEENDISDERLTREILYSCRWLYEKFGIYFRVFFGKKICSEQFNQTVYNGRFDGAVLESENENYWLEGKDRFRLFIMEKGDTVDAIDADENCEYETYGEMHHRLMSNPLDIKIVKLQKAEIEISEAEKAVLKAEKASAQAGENKAEEIRCCWLCIFNGNDECAIEKAEKIADGKSADDIVKVNNDNVKVSVFKFSEDKSSVVIRLKETAGMDAQISVMCDEIDAGFRCEIEPFETATYKIDKDGFVRETFIYE